MMSKMEGGAMDNKRLLSMLEGALQKEKSLWKPLAYKTTTQNSAVERIGALQRNRTVYWLVQLTRKFHFMPETLALSVTILDRFLHAVKARPRHLNCIGVTSIYLAAKTVEEDQVIPGTLELVQESHCGCSMSEVLRMERCMLDKLSWDLRASTPLDFLHIFHALLMAHYPHLLDSFVHMTRSRQLSVLTNKLQAVMMDSCSLKFAPSTVALALLSLELEQFWPAWCEAVNKIAGFVQLDLAEVISCRARLSSIIQQTQMLPCSSMHLYAPSTTGRLLTKSGKRKVDELSGDTDDDDQEENFYDGIKRLFVEDPPATTVLAAMRVAN